MPDGRVLKGPRPAQRKNAQFWTDVSQDTEQLVKKVQTAAEASPKVAHKPEAEPTDEQAPTVDVLPVEQEQHAHTTRVVSPRAKAAKRAANASRKGKVDKSRSSGPKPSQRGFKWTTTPTEE
jgi:hypothetical protein